MRFKIVVLISVLMMACSSTPDAEDEGSVPRTLIIGLDGIPYKTMQKMQAGGYFRSFTPVAPMVATFPSISDPNWTHILGLPPEYCYTKACFDPFIKTDSGMGRENGSLISHVNRHPLYERTVDFRAEGIFEHLTMFIWTETTGKYWAEALEEKFFSARGKDTFFALFINPDLIAHTEGEGKLMEYLAFVDKRVEILRARYKEKFGGDLTVVLVSDHGNYFTEPVDIPIETDLAKLGWRISETIAGPKDVGFYVPEILSFGAFFAQKGRERELALALSKVSHIHVSSYLDKDGSVRVIGPKGDSESSIVYDSKEKMVSYKILRGSDPLDHLQYFSKGKLGLQEYFDKSLGSQYPFAAMRLWEAFHTNSQVIPSALADAQLGYVFGNKALRLITNIKGLASSHGSLHREESFGIIMSTDKEFSAQRPQDISKITGHNSK